jgi:allantoicase
MSVNLASFADCIDLAAADLGGTVLGCSDDFFAEAERLLRPEPAVFDPHAYTERGKLMDGWESRRKRTPGHDWLVLRLGVPGVVRGFDVDTSWFLGNQPPFCTIEGCVAPADAPMERLGGWVEVLPEVPLSPGSHNLFAAARVERFTHLRLNILPDGGVARLRVYGQPKPVVRGEVDLAAAGSGGRAIACSDMFFGNMNALLKPGRAANMGGGWETRRRRDQGNDWVVVRLAGRGSIDRIVADTHHFKGNFPDRCSIEGLDDADAGPYRIERHPDWTPIVAETSMQADHAHEFTDLLHRGPFTHLRLRIYPCGGMSRLRVHGRLEHPGDLAALLNGLDEDTVREALEACCGSPAWAEGMMLSRPFADPTAVTLRADEVWWGLDEEGQREAFAHHPRIGDDPQRLRERFATTAGWASGEQAGVGGAGEETLAALQAGNVAYEERFGHVFLICATGLTAEQMLGALQRRLLHEPRHEHRIAAGEQAKITRLRLEKLEATGAQLAKRGGA